MSSIEQKLDLCHECPLGKGKNPKKIPYVPTEIHGDKTALDILFVGEAPGAQEHIDKQPFCGQSGQLLRDTIKANISTKNIAFSNVVHCRPTDDAGKNRTPTPEEAEVCRNYLRREIKQLKPRVVVLLGNVPMKYGVGADLWEGSGITKARGKAVKHKNRIYLPVWHPAYVLRNMSDKPKWENDIRRVEATVTGKAIGQFSDKGKSRNLDSVKKIKQLLDYIRYDYDKPVSVDIETTNLYKIASNKILSIQLGLGPDKGYVLLLDHKKSPWAIEERDYIVKLLRRTLSKAEKVPYWITHNGKFDYDQLSHRYKITDWSAPIVDTAFMAHLLDDNRAKDPEEAEGSKDGYKLKVLASEWLQFDHYAGEALDHRSAGSMELMELSDFIEYGGMDAYVTYRLHDYILQEADKQKYRNKLLRLTLKWGARMLELIPAMERWGINVDKRQLFLLSSEKSPVRSRLKTIDIEMRDLLTVRRANKLLVGSDERTAGMKPLFGAKDPWLFDSNKKGHLEKLFFKVLKLKPLSFGEKTEEWPEGAPSVSKSFLKEYAEGVPAAKLLAEKRGLAKLESSYIKPIHNFLENSPDCVDGRIHASFSIINTVTGRWASFDPNLQQVPRPDNEAKAAVKSIYRAARDHLLLEADYGQAEVRWWAQIAGDEKFAERFREMKKIRDTYHKNPTNELKEKVKSFCDIHRQVASLMFGIDILKVTDDQRQAAKSLAFGSIYGQSHYTLAEILTVATKKKVTPDDALKIQRRFIDAFPDAGKWLTSIEVYAQAHGYVESPFGRRRRLQHFYDMARSSEKFKGMAGAANRRARNSPIQGASADTTALAAWLMLRYIRDNNKPWRIIDVVHDSILLEVPMNYKEIAECTRVLEDIMTRQVFELMEKDFGFTVSVPFECDFKLGVKSGSMSKGVTADNLKPEYKKLKKFHAEEQSNGWI